MNFAISSLNGRGGGERLQSSRNKKNDHFSGSYKPLINMVGAMLIMTRLIKKEERGECLDTETRLIAEPKLSGRMGLFDSSIRGRSGLK
jgi:hypothetical protein